MLDLLWFLIIGLCAGWLARQMRGRKGAGLVNDLVVGVIGALLGGLILRIFQFRTAGLLGDLITATAGAILLLVILEWVAKKRR